MGEVAYNTHRNRERTNILIYQKIIKKVMLAKRQRHLTLHLVVLTGKVDDGPNKLTSGADVVCGLQFG